MPNFFEVILQFFVDYDLNNKIFLDNVCKIGWHDVKRKTSSFMQIYWTWSNMKEKIVHSLFIFCLCCLAIFKKYPFIHIWLVIDNGGKVEAVPCETASFKISYSSGCWFLWQRMSRKNFDGIRYMSLRTMFLSLFLYSYVLFMYGVE